MAGVEHRAFIHVSPELIAPACANSARLDLSVLRLHAGLGARLHGVRRGVEALARANQEYVYLKKPDPIEAVEQVIVARCGEPYMAQKNPLRKHCSEACAIYLRVNRYRKKKAAPDNSARMVLARQRLIYYRRRPADHPNQSDQPARTTSQSFFNRRQVVGFQAERSQGI